MDIYVPMLPTVGESCTKSKTSSGANIISQYDMS